MDLHTDTTAYTACRFTSLYVSVRASVGACVVTDLGGSSGTAGRVAFPLGFQALDRVREAAHQDGSARQGDYDAAARARHRLVQPVHIPVPGEARDQAGQLRGGAAAVCEGRGDGGGRLESVSRVRRQRFKSERSLERTRRSRHGHGRVEARVRSGSRGRRRRSQAKVSAHAARRAGVDGGAAGAGGAAA